MKKHIVYDNDGVIVNSFDLMLQYQMHLFNESKEQTLERINGFCVKSSKQKDDEDQGKHSEFLIEFWRNLYYFNKNSYVIPLYSGIMEVILGSKRLANQAIISSGSKPFIQASIGENQSKVFTHILSLEDGLCKLDKAKKVIGDWCVDPSQVLFITDIWADYTELCDYLDPKNIYATAWGFQGIDSLREYFDEGQILNGVMDLAKLIRS